MTGILGLRVIRGPDWNLGETDGGEGHLGTLHQSQEAGVVLVVWDNGKESRCRAGADGKYDLRIFDTAQAGVRHPNSHCSVCGDRDVYGMLWRCQSCDDCNLCSPCYNDDKHSTRHPFLRIDHCQKKGQPVQERKSSVQMRVMGIFPGATVTRGKDWTWADQDGGQGSEGEVLGFENVAPDSSRNLVRVRWLTGHINSYRLGLQGAVDLLCVDEDSGPAYYRDHLPLLDAAKLPYPVSHSSPLPTPLPHEGGGRVNAARIVQADVTNDENAALAIPPTRPPKPDWMKSREHPHLPQDQNASMKKSSPATVAQSAMDMRGTELWGYEDEQGGPCVGSENGLDDDAEEGFRLTDGDTVMVGVSENVLRDLQEDFGGVSHGMLQHIGDKGIVSKLDDGVTVQYSSKSYKFNPLALVKVSSFKEGDTVRLRKDVEQVKLLNKHIAWNLDIAEACGTVGRVLKVDNEDTMTVNFGHYQTFRLAVACCVPSPGDSVLMIGATAGARKTVLGAEVFTPEPPARAKGLGGGVGLDSYHPSVYTTVGTGQSRTLSARGLKSIEDKDLRESLNSENNSLDKGLTALVGIIGKGKRALGDQYAQLLLAIKEGERHVVQKLVRADRSLLSKSLHNITPLKYACSEGKPEIVSTLLDLGADINANGGRGKTPLLLALEKKREELALMLLDRGASIDCQDTSQQTALHKAVCKSMSQVVQVLLCMGADVNMKDKMQDTPLFDAISSGQEAMVEILLKADNLNPLMLNRKGFNMLHAACYHGRFRIVEMILESPHYLDVDDLLLGEYSALHISAMNDRRECIGRLILMGGAKIHLGDGQRGLTALHLACTERALKSAEYLIELGADVNFLDGSGSTPLHYAMGKTVEGLGRDTGFSQGQFSEQQCRLARLLITHGALVDLQDDKGLTPLLYALPVVRDNVMRFLEDKRAKEDASASATTGARDYHDNSPVHGYGEASRRTSDTSFSSVPDSSFLPSSASNFSKIMAAGTSEVSGALLGERSTTYQRANTLPASSDSQYTSWTSASSILQPQQPQQQKSSPSLTEDNSSGRQRVGATPRVQADMCANCDGPSNVTVRPCGHSSLCLQCCDGVTHCPACGYQVLDLEADNMD